MSCYFLFSSYHHNKLQLSDKNISKHTRLKFWFLLWSKSKVELFFFIPRHTKRTRSRANSCCVHVGACHTVQILYVWYTLFYCKLNELLGSTVCTISRWQWQQCSVHAFWFVCFAWVCIHSEGLGLRASFDSASSNMCIDITKILKSYRL